MKGKLFRPMLVALAIAGALLAAGGTVTSSHAATSSKIAGKWKGHYSGAVSGHFTIHWKQTGSLLHGTIKLSNPSGTYALDGSVRNGKIKFGAVTVGAKYKGKLHGTTMSGTWTSGEGGGSWSAHKTT